MSPTELIKSVEHAAAMDDRWLFVASLVVFGVFAAFVIKYFVRQHERLIEDHKQAPGHVPGASISGLLLRH
jgi:hypothetical protein